VQCARLCGPDSAAMHELKCNIVFAHPAWLEALLLLESIDQRSYPRSYGTVHDFCSMHVCLIGMRLACRLAAGTYLAS